ncbi:MAG TPA: hypothetical protein VGG04_01275 [Candidatus Sulfotelmatobacter sp.]
MTLWQKIGWSILAVVVVAAIAGGLAYLRWRSQRLIVLQGAIMVDDTDPRKERPIAGVEVTAADRTQMVAVKSDPSGLFLIPLKDGTRRGTPITLQFKHADYRDLDLKEFVGNKLYIVHLEPKPTPASNDGRPLVVIGNVTIRYSVKTTTDANIGGEVRTFQVENKGNIPCRNQNPCSPDDRWKAAIGSTTLDAGIGNQFKDSRVSCIAGPCPFTRIESQRASKGGQILAVTVRNWSDTTTFLVEAEVLHSMPTEVAHEFFPVIFGRELSFTLPAAVEGVTIEADVDQQRVFFPLGPALLLSWANCTASENADRTRVFRCGLKSGYKFR